MAMTCTLVRPLNESARMVYENAGSAIAAGDMVIIASGTSGQVGVSLNVIAATTGTGPIDVDGVFSVVKASGEALTQGQVVYFDGTQVTGTSTTTYTRAGRAWVSAASAAVVAKIRLNA